VKHHLTNIFDKVGVSTRLELAMFAIQRRIEKPDSGADN
jgi:DNA-binding NarL/FixJ family response regulator